MAVTMKNGDRFRIERDGAGILIQRAHRYPEGWAVVGVKIDPKQDLRLGPLASFRHYNTALRDALKFRGSGTLKPTRT